LNALSTPQNKQNSFRQDGIVGISGNNGKNGMAKNMSIRQSANNGISTGQQQ
jgi:hypothetical protein